MIIYWSGIDDVELNFGMEIDFDGIFCVWFFCLGVFVEGEEVEIVCRLNVGVGCLLEISGRFD